MRQRILLLTGECFGAEVPPTGDFSPFLPSSPANEKPSAGHTAWAYPQVGQGIEIGQKSWLHGG